MTKILIGKSMWKWIFDDVDLFAIWGLNFPKGALCTRPYGTVVQQGTTPKFGEGSASSTNTRQRTTTPLYCCARMTKSQRRRRSIASSKKKQYKRSQKSTTTRLPAQHWHPASRHTVFSVILVTAASGSTASSRKTAVLLVLDSVAEKKTRPQAIISSWTYSSTTVVRPHKRKRQNLVQGTQV